MSQSQNSVYLTAVNLMVMGALSSICRDYFRIRHIPWEGEKAAIRYLYAHQPEFLNLLELTISEPSLVSKLTLYEDLVIQTLKPIGELWGRGLTAAYLRNVPQINVNLETALDFWQNLISDQ